MSGTAFCPACGHATSLVARGGRDRPTCPACRFVHWRNPKVGVAVILQNAAQEVLLVERRTPPGTWCIPCGNVEWDEEVRVAAGRELLEETGFHATVGAVYAVRSNTHDPQAHSVGIWFLGEIAGGVPIAGGDAVDVGWFDPAHPPGPLAFPTDRLVLEALSRGDSRGDMLP